MASVHFVDAAFNCGGVRPNGLSGNDIFVTETLRLDFHFERGTYAQNDWGVRELGGQAANGLNKARSRRRRAKVCNSIVESMLQSTAESPAVRLDVYVFGRGEVKEARCFPISRRARRRPHSVRYAWGSDGDRSAANQESPP